MPTITPNMSLTLPTIGVDPAPTYGTYQNNSFSSIDQHDHSSGRGIPVTPAGLSITSDLSFLLNNAIQLRSVRFNSNVSALPNSTPDVGCLYVAGNELYYNDVTGGHQVQITSGGAVSGATGTITGLPSGTAGAAYSSVPKSFIFTSATSVPANIDAGSYLLRNLSTPTNAITLAAPGSVAAAYSITFPLAAPGATAIVQLDPSGNLSANNTLPGSITIGSSGANLTSSGTALVVGGGIFPSTVSRAELVADNANTLGVVDPGTSSNFALIVSAAGNTTGLLMVRGSVSASGSTNTGEGFSTSHAGTGTYNITFAAAFADQPVVIASMATSLGYTNVTSASTSGCTIVTSNPATSPSDLPFNFIAMGQRSG